MLEETTIIKSKAIFSDDKEHRLLLRKEWNSEKPSAMVIMINPNTANTGFWQRQYRESVQQNHGKAQSSFQW